VSAVIELLEAKELDAKEGDAGRWHMEVPRRFHGAFGGAFGGMLAAASVAFARQVAPGRVPSALDCRFLRGLPAGGATVTAEVIHRGRSLSCVSLDVWSEAGKRCTRSTVSLVEAEALYPFDHEGYAVVPELTAYEDGTPWAQSPSLEVPIIDTFAPRMVGNVDGAIATTVVVPWDDPAAAAEAACLAADMSVGPPVAGANTDRWIPNPNPDLTLRFAAPQLARHVTSVCRLERIKGGIATTQLHVWSEGVLAAVGISTSLLLNT